MPAVLSSLLGGLGTILLQMITALLSKSVLEYMVLQGLDLAVSRYERTAAKTEKPEDDELAKKLRGLLEQVEAEMKGKTK